MLRLIIHRLLWSIPLIFVVTFLTFLLNALAPGDLAQAMLQGNGTPDQVAELRHKLGLDLPVLVQYGNWLGQALQGNLGHSAFTGESVIAVLNSRLGVTLSIMIGTAIVCLVIGIGLGVLSALRGGVTGRVLDFVSLGGLVFPSFWVALVFIAVFAVGLRWFPATGYTPFKDSPAAWAACLVLPVFAVALQAITRVAKQTRDAMADAMSRDYIRSLQACGLPWTSIVLKHALRNASLPLVTVLGLVMVTAITATVFVEKVFVLPGLGSLAVEATQQFDIFLLQGATLYFTIITIAINLIVDLSYGWLNPKVRVS